MPVAIAKPDGEAPQTRMIHAHLGEGILTAYPGLTPDCFSFLGSRLTDWTIKGLKEIGYFTGPADDPSFLINQYVFPEDGGSTQVPDNLDHRMAETRQGPSLRGPTGGEEKAGGGGASGEDRTSLEPTGNTRLVVFTNHGTRARVATQEGVGNGVAGGRNSSPRPEEEARDATPGGNHPTAGEGPGVLRPGSAPPGVNRRTGVQTAIRAQRVVAFGGTRPTAPETAPPPMGASGPDSTPQLPSGGNARGTQGESPPEGARRRASSVRPRRSGGRN